MVSRFFTIICKFFSKRAEKGIFHAWKSQWLGDTLVIHFLYETQLMIVNCIVAAQGYQIQATRWRELSILLGARWYIFSVITFFTELTHQSDAELVTMKVCRVYHHVSPRRITRLRLGDTGFSLLNRITRVRLGDTAVSLLKCITKVTPPELEIIVTEAYHRNDTLW